MADRLAACKAANPAMLAGSSLMADHIAGGGETLLSGMGNRFAIPPISCFHGTGPRATPHRTGPVPHGARGVALPCRGGGGTARIR